MIHLGSSQQYKFILIATKYFRKWVEAIPLIKYEGINVALFIFNQIICQFRIPDLIIMDNGKSFCNKQMDEIYYKDGITHKLYSPYYPQENGLVEAFNETLIKILKKIIYESQRDWNLKLFPILWAYHTTTKNATSMTPFLLVYGMEEFILLKIEIPLVYIAT